MLLTYPTTRLSLCVQVIDWYFCARVFSCPVGKACLALFRKDGVIVTRCRLFGGGPPRGGPPRGGPPRGGPPREGRPAQIRHET
jgi:hypothetical protein